jgi:7-carboxy-7-deazaguanine synthase
VPGEEARNDLENLRRLTDKDEIKFVIGDRVDYEFAKDILDFQGRGLLIGNLVHFSPLFEKMEPRLLAGWILEDCLNVRLHMQLHKIIWDPAQRGV